MKLQLTVKECAAFIGKNPMYVSMGLRAKRFPFGSAVQTKPPTKTRPQGSWDYDIQRILVERYVGCSYEKWLKNKKEND